MTSQLEKRVLISFFIATFAMISILTLLSWLIIRYAIDQSEEKDIADNINLINKRLVEYSSTIYDKLDKLVRNKEFIQALSRNDTAHLSRLLAVPKQTTAYRLFQIYSDTGELIVGDRFPSVEHHIFKLLDRKEFQSEVFYPIAVGQETYTFFIRKIFSSPDTKENLLGYLCYFEHFREPSLRISADLQPYLFSGAVDIEQQHLPERHRHLSNQLTNMISTAVEQSKESKILRFGIESGGGLLILYDVFSKPAMYVFFPYTRSLNQFAHRGLLVFMLILAGLALLMITLAGTWFRGKIIAPVKEVSLKMQEIEGNPARIVPMDKKYSGILGDMIDTFNSMNKALYTHSYSLGVYKTISDNLDSGILWMDSEYNILLCNPSIAKLFEMDDCSEVIGKNLNELIHIEGQLQIKPQTNEIYIPRVELTIGESRKYVRFVIFSIKKVDDISGVRHIASIYDITKETQEANAREKLEFELIKSNRLAELGRLAEGVVHNINSPLNSIIGYAQLMKRTDPDNQDINKIIAAGRNISEIVKKLLSKAREDSISMLRPLDINELVSLELDMCRHNIYFFQNVSAERELNPLRRKVLASHGDISNCISNIINNAIQAMKTSKKKILTVVTDETEVWTTIKISDTGKGIPPENFGKIFNPDFTTKKEGEGAGFGLGLAISKSIIEKYKGRIEVESIVGQGTSFTIFLPNTTT